jgi:hypothetical protein
MVESLAVRKFKVVNIIFNKSLFNDNIIYIILNHYWNLLDNKHKVLLDWIPIDKINWSELSVNPNAINLLKDNLDKIDSAYLSCNKNAINLLENNIDKINWFYLSGNKLVIKMQFIY